MKLTTKDLILALGFVAMSEVAWAQADHSFISRQSGPWGNGLTWEEYIPNIGYIYPATQIPNSGNGAIRIAGGHTVTISGGNVIADQLTIDGRLQVSSGSTLTIADGPGVDLYMNNPNATLWIDGTLVNNGTIQIDQGALKIGTLVNNGAITIGGVFNFDQGSITGNDLRFGPTGSLVINLPSGSTVDQDNRIWPVANGPANVTVIGNATLNAARTVSGLLRVAGILNVVGTLTTNGTTEVTGTLNVVGTQTNNGTTQTFGTLQIAGTYANNGTTQIYGTCQINSGGIASGNGFVYSASSKLVFNGANSVGNAAAFWPGLNSPANVVVLATANVTLKATRTLSGNLDILGTLQVADTLTTNGTTRVAGQFQIAGKLTNTGTTQIYDTLAVAGTFINIGTTQVYRTLKISGLFQNDGTMQVFSNCQLAGRLINNGIMQVDGFFQFDQGGSANGSDFTYGVNGTLVFNNASGSYAVNKGSVYWPHVNGPANVTLQGAGGITLNDTLTVNGFFQTAARVMNANQLTFSGGVRIDAGGSFDSSPNYSGDATLIYDTGVPYNVGAEWASGASVGVGVPRNVEIYENATVNMPGSARTCPGNLTIRGALALNTTPGANLSAGGNWYSYNGTFIPNSRAVIFNGAVEQIIRGTTAFDSLLVNNPAGISLPGNSYEVEESDSATVRRQLTFMAGNIRLGKNWQSYLFLNGAVDGFSANRHVVTFGESRVVRTIAGGGSFQFPISPTETSYNPVTITLAPTDSTETFSVRVDSTIDLGAPDDSLFVQRTWDIQEATPGDNHAALTFQWAGAEEGAKFTRNASSTYLYDVEVTQNSVASGTDPYVVGTTGGFPCTEFARYTVGNTGALTHEEAIAGLIAANDGPTPLDSVTTLIATVTTGTNVYFTWSFGDGTSDVGDVVTHTYTAAGNYTAIVTATNTLGSVSDTTSVNIFIAPITGLAASNNGPTRLGNVTTLTATATAGSRVEYVWNFGDGTPVDSGAAVKHTYRAVGIYLAVVTATNAVTTLTDTTKVIVTPTTIVEESEDKIPTAFMLGQNYPNPFNPVTTIQFSVPLASYVRLKVYNAFGAEVATLVDQQVAAGAYKVNWDASRLASGFYLYRLEAEGFTQTKKLLLMK